MKPRFLFLNCEIKKNNHRLLFPLNDESGSVLAATLLFLLVIMAMIPIATKMSAKDIDRTEKFEESQLAFYSAEAGVEHTKSILRTISFNDALDGDDNNKATTGDNGIFAAMGATTVVEGNNFSQTAFNGNNYYVRVFDNDDGDGDIWNDSDGLIYIEARGTSPDGTLKKIEVGVKQNNLILPNFPAAITLLDDAVEIDPTGNSFLVDGSGVLPDSQAPNYALPDPSCTSVYSVVAEATGSSFDQNQMNHTQQDDNFPGLNGDPSFLENYSGLTLTELQTLRSSLIPRATTLPAGNYNSATLGTTSNPGIYYINDSFNIQGTTTGAGVLIVDRDFEVSGNFTWEGLILVGLCSTCDGRLHNLQGNTHIYGAIAAANTTPSYSNETRLEIRGNAQIYYSCSALQNAISGLNNNSFKEVSWTQTQ